MLSQTKKERNQRFSHCSFSKKNRKAVSVMIGYVLLVTFVVVMGIIVYNWMKTYVPREDLDCPDGVSIFIKDYDCDPAELSLTLTNNGKFNIGGYFIHVANVSEQEIATIDISNRITSGEDVLSPNGIKFNGSDNSFSPNEEVTDSFSIAGLEMIYSVEVIPIRWQEENRRSRLVSCKDSAISEVIDCSDTVITCTDTCLSLNYECGTHTICEESVDCGEGQTCEDLYGTGYICNSTGRCVYSADCGNGIIDSGEQCDDEDTEDGDGCSSSCLIENGWQCSGEPSSCNKIRMQITFIDFENSGEISNWDEDPGQSVYGETLAISVADECTPTSGTYMLSGTGNFDPNLVRYERTAIDVSGYESILIEYSMASEDTETADRIEFYYYDGSSWELCNVTVGRNGNTCAGWEDFICPVSLDSGTTDLVIGVAWETSATNEHAFWDKINITGMVA